MYCEGRRSGWQGGARRVHSRAERHLALPHPASFAITQMIVGTGIDIAETDRIQQALERHGERFSKKVFTPSEIAYCERFKNRAERYAARFAAKEAAFKALGTGWAKGVRWLDVETTHQASGKPDLLLTGRALEVAEQLGVTRAAISISHANHYVVAQVILESNT